jgi:tetratricopeptide (TPR) repeat protein
VEQALRDRLLANPRDHEAWNALAWIKIQAGEADVAVEYARRAHELERRNVNYLNCLGVAHAENGELTLARDTLQKALRLQPVFVDALVNVAKVLAKLGDAKSALAACERAYALAPAYPKLGPALATMYRESGMAPRARQLLESSKGWDPEDVAFALARCDYELSGAEAAIDRLRRALREHPQWREVGGLLAEMLLGAGRWREGWPLYRPQVSAPLPPDLAGRTMVLRGEQGIGDVLFFLRFVPALRERGGHVTLACGPRLLALLREHERLDAIVEDAPALQATPIEDLPALLGSEVTPPPWPLALDAGIPPPDLGPRPWIGATWRAGTDLARQPEVGQAAMSQAKAVPPGLLGAALRGWPGTVIVLQRGGRPEDLAQFAAALGGPYRDLSSTSEDLPSLLALLASLDEYVGVSNTNIHMLAGLGKTGRVLVPYPGEWRWMSREEQSPWFPGFAVYRQPQSRDWAGPLAKLRGDLLGSA